MSASGFPSVDIHRCKYKKSSGLSDTSVNSDWPYRSLGCQDYYTIALNINIIFSERALSAIHSTLVLPAHKGMFSENFPDMRHVEVTDPDTSYPRIHVKVTTSPTLYSAETGEVKPFLGTPGKEHVISERNHSIKRNVQYVNCLLAI